jgi:protein-tyrosine kinase
MAERLKQALERAMEERTIALRSRDARVTPLVQPAAGFSVHKHDSPLADSLKRQGAASGRELPIDAQRLRRERILPPLLAAPVESADTNPAIQAYKMLRTQVLQRMDANRWNTLAVMSATPGDGKTLTAINLAIAIAAGPHRSALLLDFDLRRPALAQRLGFDASQYISVDEVMAGRASANEACIHLPGYERLTVMAAARPVANSSELLTSAGTRRMLNDLRSTAPGRILLIDLPPVLGADDAVAFAPQVDAVLLVIGSNHTRSADVIRSFELLRNKPVVGTVLNRSRTTAAGDYSY